MSSRAPRYRAAIFDIDDTLLTTREPKWRQHIWIAKHYYNIHLTESVLKLHWGKPFDELTAALYNNQGAAEERRANFSRHELEFPKGYEPYALESLTTLHQAGIALGLMTAMYTEGAMIDLNNVGLPLDWFTFVQGCEMTQFHKPDGRVFTPALRMLHERHISNTEIVYVGEALSDLRAAQDAGLDFISITQGMVDERAFQEAGATVICKDLRQVTQLILNPTPSS